MRPLAKAAWASHLLPVAALLSPALRWEALIAWGVAQWPYLLPTGLKEDRFRLWIWTEGLISGFLPRSLVLNAQ